MMIKSSEIKDRLILIISNEGINQKFVANKTNIAESSLSKFKNGTMDLKHTELERLNEWLTSKGY